MEIFIWMSKSNKWLSSQEVSHVGYSMDGPSKTSFRGLGGPGLQHGSSNIHSASPSQQKQQQQQQHHRRGGGGGGGGGGGSCQGLRSSILQNNLPCSLIGDLPPPPPASLSLSRWLELIRDEPRLSSEGNANKTENISSSNRLCHSVV